MGLLCHPWHSQAGTSVPAAPPQDPGSERHNVPPLPVPWVREAKSDSSSLGCPVGHSCRANIGSSGDTVVKPLPSAASQSELQVQASHEAATLTGGQALATHPVQPPGNPTQAGSHPSSRVAGGPSRVRWCLAASPWHRRLQGSAAAWTLFHTSSFAISQPQGCSPGVTRGERAGAAHLPCFIPC